MNPLNNSQQQQPGMTGGMGGTNNAAAGEHKDYGDKAFDFLSKKSGHSMNASTSEKITDGARGVFEKVSGYGAPTLIGTATYRSHG